MQVDKKGALRRRGSSPPLLYWLFYWKGILLARPWTEAWIESFVHFILLDPSLWQKTKSVLRENTSCKRLKSKGKILFWILVRHSSLWSEAVDFQWIFFKGSSLKIACQEKAIFNAFLQRKPPLNVERIDASFLLTNFFFKICIYSILNIDEK